MWYSTGTCTVTNGSPTVTGSGTSWVGTIDAGWGLVAPDGKVYEVLSVDSATQLTLAKNYAGSNASGQAYSLFPTQGLVRALTAQVLQLINDYAAVAAGPGAGKFSAGTAALPGVAASTDLDTGIAWLAANVLGISTGGLERVRFDGSGRIGQRVSAPEYYYDIRAINFGSSQAPQGVALRGTASADLSGAGWLGGLFMESNGSGQNSISLYGPNATTAGANTMQKAVEVFGSGATQQLRLHAGGTERLRIESGGFVGLGNLGAADATVLLDVADTSAAVMRVASDGTQAVITERASTSAASPAQLQLRRSRGTVAAPAVVQQGDEIGDISFFGHDGAGIQRAARIQAYVDGTPGAGDMPGRLTFSTTPDGSAVPVERVRVNSTGQVGIGTTNPSAELHVRGAGEVIRTEGTAARGSGNVFNTFHDPTGRKGYVGYGSTVDDDFYINNEMNAALRLYSNGAERMRITSAGQVGVGTTNPAHTLDVNGAINAAGNMFFGGDLVWTKSDLRIYPPTADGADTSRVVLLGGGAWSTTRGAQLVLTGNEHADAGGWILGAGTNGVGQISAGGGVTLNGGTPGVKFDSTAIHLAHSAAPTLAATRQMAFTLTSNTNLRISVRGADGVTRTANITLS